MSCRWMLAAIFCLGNLTAASSEAAASSSDELLAQAAAAPAPCWKYLDEKYSVELKPVFALQYLAVAAHESPNQVVAGRTLAAHVAGKLRSILVSSADDANAPSREPPAQGGIGGWTHNTLAQCLLIARRTPAIWIELQPVEHQRADLLMHALALAAHYSLDDENDFYVLLDGKSHYHRSWNPNHVGGQVGIIVAASLYFGADALNAFFEGFAFDRFERELAAANFRNIRRCWTRDARIKELLMHGGTIALADNAVLAQGVRTSGKGVRNRFSYEGIPLEDPWKLYRAEALRLYSKAARTIVTIQGNNTSKLLGRASTAAVSPWEGQMGMCHEFESTDWDGMRTSAIYAYEGVMIDLSTASALKILGEWRASDGGDLIERRMGVGLADLRFKVREGYRGWSGGKEHFTWWEKDLEPMGAGYVFGLWENYFSPPSPPLSAH